MPLPDISPNNETSIRKHAWLLHYLVISVLVLVFLAIFLTVTYKSREKVLESSSLNEATILATQIDSALRRIDSTLNLIADKLVPAAPKSQGRDWIEERLSIMRGDFPELHFYLIVGKDGKKLANSMLDLERYSIADSDYFKQLKSAPDRQIHYSESLKLKDSEKPFLAIYRAIISPQGEFQGAVVAAFDLEYIAQLFSKLDVGEQGMVSVRRSDDSRLVVRWPIVEKEINQAGPKPPPYLKIQEGIHKGVIRYIGKTDGIDRIFAFHKVERGPFFVLVGRSVVEGFAQWRQTALIATLLAVAILAYLGYALYRMNRTEEGLRISEKRLEMASEIARQGWFEANIETGDVAVSPGYARLLGYEPSEFISSVSNWMANIHPDDLPLLKARFQLALETGAVQEMQYRRRNKAGDWEWIDSVGQVTARDASGKPLRLTGIHMDITERKRAEDILQHYKTMMERTESLARMGSFEWEVDANKVTWSPEMFRILGRDPALGTPNLEGQAQLYTPASTQLLFDAVNKALSDGTPYQLERIAELPDGDLRTCYVKAFPERDASGRVVRIAGLVQDITERKRAEVELQQYRHHLEDLVKTRTAELMSASRRLTEREFAMDRVGIATHLVDATSGRFLWANRAAADMLGYTQQEMVGLHISDIDPNMTPAVLPQIIEEIRGKKFLRFETTQRRKDGSNLPVEMTVYYHPDEADEPSRFISFGIEISARKAAEADLVAARQAAETANIAKSAFLANMSHEIRTPLNAITGMAHILRRSGLTPEQTDKLDKIENAGNHLLNIINDVLDLSKIEAGKFALEDAPIRVDALLGNIASMLSQKARDKGLRFQAETVSLPHNLHGDPTRLQQALLNYASNALKFTEAGHITLRVKEEAHTDETATLRFEVEDSGIGIAPEALPKLFSSFEQADNSTTRKYGGTGLGLAITKRIAEVMGGTAGVTSIPGQGSTFWFTAVLRKGPQVAVEPARAGLEAAEQALRRDHAGQRILLAEDEPINREIAQMLLEDVGLQVDLAEDGREAVEKARSGSYAIILMDMQMPVLDGLNATREIRQLPGCEAIPILAMTANAFAENKDQCFEAGMDDFIAKPAMPEVLYETLLKWFHKGEC